MSEGAATARRVSNDVFISSPREHVFAAHLFTFQEFSMTALLLSHLILNSLLKPLLIIQR